MRESYYYAYYYAKFKKLRQHGQYHTKIHLKWLINSIVTSKEIEGLRIFLERK